MAQCSQDADHYNTQDDAKTLKLEFSVDKLTLF